MTFYKIFVASQSPFIYTIYFDSSTNTLGYVAASPDGIPGLRPTWIEKHPKDSSIIFATSAVRAGKAYMLKFDDYGKGTVIAAVMTHGVSPCHITVSDEEEIMIANYMSGSISIMKLSLMQSPYFLSPTSAFQLYGSGPDSERQDSAHAHQMYLIKEHGELLVPDLGGDCIYRFKKTNNGNWALYSEIHCPPGSGPRHVTYSCGAIYIVFELANAVAALPYSPSQEYIKIPSHALRPTMFHPPPKPSDMRASEVLVPTPNYYFQNLYVYASNRNDPSQDGDTIAIFTGYPDVKLVNEVRTGLHHLRGMMFGGPDDRWLIAGGADCNCVKVFERVDGGRALKEIACMADDRLSKPSGFVWA